MATVQTAVNESVYQIKKWLGVNEATEGEASLKMGEAAVMRNFRVTAGGALRKRPGSRNVAGLVSEYVLNADADNPETLFYESGESTLSLTMYPSAGVDSMGNISLQGEPLTVTNENADGAVGYYYRSENGGIYRFAGLERGSA